MSELLTERLTLRPHTGEDFPEVAAMWGDPAVTRHIGGRPSSREEAWTRFCRNVGHRAVLGWGYWVVRERAGGAFVGEVGFANLKRELEPAFGDAPEMGWVLAASAQGKGYATEAGRAAIAWAEGHFGRVRMVCLIEPDNTPSIRVAERLGFVPFAATTYKEHPAVLFERLALSETAPRPG